MTVTGVVFAKLALMLVTLVETLVVGAPVGPQMEVQTPMSSLPFFNSPGERGWMQWYSFVCLFGGRKGGKGDVSEWSEWGSGLDLKLKGAGEGRERERGKKEGGKGGRGERGEVGGEGNRVKNKVGKGKWL